MVAHNSFSPMSSVVIFMPPHERNEFHNDSQAVAYRIVAVNFSGI